MSLLAKSFVSTPTREQFALFHAGLMVVLSAWLLGGIGPRNEWIVAAVAAPAFAVLFAEARARRRAGDRAGFRRLLRWTTPLIALAVLITISALNPSFRPAFIFDGYVLRPVPHVTWLPSSATPAGSLRLLACFGGLAATGLSLAFCVHSRSAIRALASFLALHALVLAVFGTLQQQTGASGPYFGAVPLDRKAWFATFLYHNHWGAFAVLHVAAAIGLVFHSLHRQSDRGWHRGPGPMLALSALLVAATTPLSTSRSTTVLMLVLAAAATVATVRHALQQTHGRRGAKTRWLPIVSLGVALTATVGLAAFQGRDVIALRWENTRAQIAALQEGTTGYTRFDLYADTWRMAADKPVFGWGLESYGPIFLHYSRFRPKSDGVINTFVDAHSDWLQSLAEIGFVGTALLLALALVPLAEAVRWRRLDAFSGWLLGGCALIAAYAWLEFPLACPAVVATWWILWFAAIRGQQLTPSPASAKSSPGA